MKYKIYSDGAMSSSRNQGGWAYVLLVDNEKKFSDYDVVPDTTNNRMEIQAALEAILYCKKKGIKEFELYTDSMYVIGTMTKEWKRNKNNDLWDLMDNAVKNLIIDWKHQKGHTGDKWNEHCDMLAVHASHLIIKE